MITKETFLEKYNITEPEFQAAAISWEELCMIYEDFSLNQIDKYTNILEQFTNTYLKTLNTGRIEEEEGVRVHSVRSRVKNPEHLLEKIIRKKQENDKKYKEVNKDNYEKFITDLIGIRCLILFKEDWISFHNYLLSNFENDAQYYIKNPVRDFDENEEHNYIAEEPKVHIRNGDPRDIYEGVLSPDHIIDGKEYRSVHYIIKYKGVYLEIQVRTLFEEGWGEVDHAVVYPYFKDDPVLKEYTKLLNRLSGLADEMSGFFYSLKKLEIEHLKHQNVNDVRANESTYMHVEKEALALRDKPELENEGNVLSTPGQCLCAVLDE